MFQMRHAAEACKAVAGGFRPVAGAFLAAAQTPCADTLPWKSRLGQGRKKPDLPTAILPSMARISNLTNLFHAVSARDWSKARTLAEGIVEAEEKAGHHGAAARLRGALVQTGPRVDETGSGQPLPSFAAVQPDLLTALPSSGPLADVTLSKDTRALLDEVLREHRNKSRLLAHGLRPRSRIFFHGPPGCGKTLTARALGVELVLPVFIVRFDTLVGSYLGQTSLRIREVFRFAEATPSVVLIDEIDAVGRRRGKMTDVGELDRVVISLMQQLDLSHPAGLLIATSNIPDELDIALLRRFDLNMEFPAPGAAEVMAFARQQADKRGIRLINGVRHELASAKTFADAEQILQGEQRRALLKGV
jgi:ATPase family associated with various cellular activities (AAA)